MTVTVDALITPPTQDEIDQTLLDVLALLGLPTTSWADGGVVKTLVELHGETVLSLWKKVAQIAKGGYRTEAKGLWLDALAKQFFELDRHPGTNARHTVTVQLATGSGPITLQARQLWIRDPITRRRFVGPEILTVIPDGAKVPLTFVGEAIGTAHNLGPNRLSELLTPIPGLTIVSSELSLQGTEVESDDLLGQRCGDKWGTIGSAMNADGFRYWARTIAPEVTRFSSREISGDVHTYLAGPSGPASPSTITAVDAKYQALRVLGVLYYTHASASLPVTGTMTVEIKPGYGTIGTTIEDAWRSYLGTLEGGKEFRRDDIVLAIRSIPGVISVPLGAFTSPASDFIVPPHTVPQLSMLNLSTLVQS